MPLSAEGFTGLEPPEEAVCGAVRVSGGRLQRDYGNVLKDEPATAASVAIYALEDLPALAVPGDPQDGSRRTLAIQYEDPCGAAAELGATDRREWIERLITYARYSGQNTLAYPIVWYHGPLYPSQREPVNYIGMTSSKVDRRLISHWTTQPQDWLAELLKRFGQEQMQFRAVLPVFRSFLDERKRTHPDAAHCRPKREVWSRGGRNRRKALKGNA